MITVRSVAELRSTLDAPRRTGAKIGLVPTMGALHEGHLSLIRHARAHCDLVVVSLFVNPAQFNEAGDLERYPRREHDDAQMASQAGADVLFAPPVEEVYPPGFATSVEVLGVTERLEGAERGVEHFRGVATVVSKLLCMALPEVAYFGQKDAQQVFVIRRLIADLNIPVQIEALATVRGPDGLAMSSRNALLNPEERARALALSRALTTAHELAAGGERSSRVLLACARETMGALHVTPEYVEIVDPDTFEAIEELAGEALMVIAARVGSVRLIDNSTLRPQVAIPTPDQPPGKAITTCSA